VRKSNRGLHTLILVLCQMTIALTVSLRLLSFSSTVKVSDQFAGSFDVHCSLVSLFGDTWPETEAKLCSFFAHRIHKRKLSVRSLC
jgi:hypothetical protein